MGDISEVRILVTIISFMGCFLIVVGLIPSYYFVGETGGTQASYPNYFDISDITAYNMSETLLVTLNQSWDFKTFGLGGHSFIMKLDFGYDDWVRIEHFFWWGPFPTNYHTLKWYDSDGILASVATYQEPHHALRIATLDTYEYGETFTLKCEHLVFSAVFGYNQTLYSSHLEAFNAEKLDLWIGINWDQTATTMNAWQLIGLLLTFQMPDIHWSINAMIAIPIWASIAYLIYVLIIKLIPFVGGG